LGFILPILLVVLLLILALLLLIVLLLAILLLILLILLFLLVLLLLLFLFLQLLDPLAHEITIVLRIGVIGFDLQRGVIRLYRLLPSLDRLLWILLLCLLA